MPPKKIKNNERCFSPSSSIIKVGKKIKANPAPPSQPPIPVQTALVPTYFCSSPPNIQSTFQSMDEWARKSYSVEIDSPQWIDPKLITFERLKDKSRFPLYENKLFVMKSKNICNEIFNFVYEGEIEAYLVGPTGVGKSYALIQTVFEIKKHFNEKYRVLHIILNDNTIKYPFAWFPINFIYCFCYDFDDKNFPKPPENDFIYNDRITMGENWFNFLTDKLHINVIFFQSIWKYFENKGIKLILIWDQDNVFNEKNKKKMNSTDIDFLKSLKNSKFIHFRLISASNHNEDFEDLNPATGSLVLIRNEGLTKKECSIMIEFLKKKDNINLKIDHDLIFELTNGNGYLISQFMQTKGETFQTKLDRFTEETSGQMRNKIILFFQSKLVKLPEKQWIKVFPEILNYLDQEIKIPQEIGNHIDKNFTYVDENGYLKSTCNLAKKNFLNCYLENLNFYDTDNLISIKMWNDLMRQTNKPLKGWIFENFVIMKFCSKLSKEFALKHYTKLLNGGLQENKDLLSIKFEAIKCFSNIQEINDITKSSTSVLLKPYCERNQYFDFLIWDGEKKLLYMFQITINDKHDPSDELFFQKKKKEKVNNYMDYHHITKNQIKFVWITIPEKKDLQKIMRTGSFLIYFEEKTIQKN